MNAEGQHERQRIGQAKCQKGAGLEQKTSTNLTNVTNSINEDSPTRPVLETRRIKKERNLVEATNENGTNGGNNNNLAGNNDTTAGTSENGHHHSRLNNVSRTNGFHSSDILQEIIAAKFGQSSTGHGNSNKNDKIRLMIEDSLRFEQIFFVNVSLNILFQFIPKHQ